MRRVAVCIERSGERLFHPIGRHRQMAQPLASELEDGTGDRRGDGHDTNFAHSAGRIVSRQDLGVDFRHLAHAFLMWIVMAQASRAAR